jgi:hypothetical protein
MISCQKLILGILDPDQVDCLTLDPIGKTPYIALYSEAVERMAKNSDDVDLKPRLLVVP